MISAEFYWVCSELGSCLRACERRHGGARGAVKPDIGSVERLWNTLLEAKSIAYSDSGSIRDGQKAVFIK
jgi:hypothetical protein